MAQPNRGPIVVEAIREDPFYKVGTGGFHHTNTLESFFALLKRAIYEREAKIDLGPRGIKHLLGSRLLVTVQVGSDRCPFGMPDVSN
jgi:hypothetical protein